MGRRLKEFDRSQFEKLCSILCTHEEIASFFDTTKDTLYKWVKRTYKEDISTVYKRYSDNGRISLRRMQFKSAERGNVTMQIFLGKQLLGQSDKVEQTVNSIANDEALDKLQEAIKKAQNEETKSTGD